MIDHKKYREMLERLLVKAIRDQVNWQRIQNAYYVQIPPNVTIEIRLFTPEAEPDWAKVEFSVESNTIYGEQCESDTDESGLFELLQSIWTEADRVVVGWDKAIEYIEKALDSDEKIGTKMGEFGVAPSNAPNDDVPF